MSNCAENLDHLDVKQSFARLFNVLRIILRFDNRISEIDQLIDFENNVFKISFGHKREFEYKKDRIKIGWGKKLQENYLFESDVENIDEKMLKKIVLDVVRSLIDENLIYFVDRDMNKIVLCQERLYSYNIENYVGFIYDLLQFTEKDMNNTNRYYFENDFIIFRQYEDECRCEQPKCEKECDEGCDDDCVYEAFECTCFPDPHIYFKELGVRIYFNHYFNKVRYSEIKKVALIDFMDATRHLIESIV